jgi:hypothetical protein
LIPVEASQDDAWREAITGGRTDFIENPNNLGEALGIEELTVSDYRGVIFRVEKEVLVALLKKPFR